jgi:hypothetical protein
MTMKRITNVLNYTKQTKSFGLTNRDDLSAYFKNAAQMKQLDKSNYSCVINSFI